VGEFLGSRSAVDGSDPTRAPEYYDSTYRYLTELGIPELC
jgi:hypothetical protein